MEETITKKVKNIFKGVSIAIIFTLLSLFIFAIILTYTNVQESFIQPVIIVITEISIFIGSSIGNIHMQKNGILNGGIIGATYLIIIYMISSIINNNFKITKETIIIMVAGMIFGVIGGIIGVNKKQ